MDLKKSYERKNYVRYFQNELFKDNFKVDIEEDIIDNLSNNFDRIQSITKLGEAEDIDDLKVYEIIYKGERDPRVTLTKDIFKFMSNTGQTKLLCVLKSDEAELFRLSLVTVDAEIKDKKLLKIRSNPRRYSFLLGPGAKVKTVEQRLDKLGRIKDINDLKERFSVEVVNKEFYNSIAVLFTRLAGGKRKIGNKETEFEGILVYPRNNDIKPENRRQKMQEFAVRLIGRSVFAWFLKKKSSTCGNPLIKESVLSSKASNDNKNYYNRVLEKLFFEVLNTDMNERKPEIQKDERFKDVPFLNGGLFEPHKEDFYDGKGSTAIPDEWFSNNEGTGLFDLLELYNFTIDENTTNDVELSIDPEMLGRIFENLLAEINPETGESARKSSGSFYTPRPIVDYKVNESLKQYLLTKTAIKEELIDNVIDDFKDEDELEITPDEAKEIRDALGVLKILDPACGSGAFPMGILHKVFNIRKKIDKLIKESALKESKERTKESLIIKRGQKITYNPDKMLNIECIYQGNSEFQYIITDDGEAREKGTKKVNDLTKIIKSYINFYNTKNDRKTVANLFSQGQLEGEKSAFVSLRNTKGVKRIVDGDDPSVIVWEWKDYNTKGKNQPVSGNKGLQPLVSEDEDNYFSDESSYGKYLYSVKEEIILKTIYGVDIQPVAVEISKLRAFLSLVVDEDVRDDEPNRGIEPLPNLEFKFVAANSLIGLPGRDQADLWEDKLVEVLKDVREQYFSSYGKKKKETIDEYNMKREAILRSLGFYKSNDFKAKMLASWNPFSDESAEWFDPEWMFGVKGSVSRGGRGDAEVGGFDIVIGNPPYVQLQKMKGNPIQQAYKDQKYEVHDSNGDLYCLFYERGINLLKNDGILCYITSNKWMRAGYGEKLREYFIKQTPFVLIDLGPGVFESATVDTNILVIKKGKNRKNGNKTNGNRDDLRNKDTSGNKEISGNKGLQPLVSNDDTGTLGTLAATLKKSDNETPDIASYLKENGTILTNLTKDAWFIGSAAEQKLKEKIERIGKPLKEWDVNIYRGVLTGLNEAFIIDQATRDRLVAEDPKSAEILKPLLKKDMIKAYQITFNGFYLINTHNGIKSKNVPYINVKENFPSIYNYLNKQAEFIENGIIKRKGGHSGNNNSFFKRTDQGVTPYNLRDCAYLDKFECPKIIWKQTSIDRTFTFDNSGYYLDVTGQMLTLNDNNISRLKYLLGLLHSKVIYYFLKMCASYFGNEGLRWIPDIIFKIPIPPITADNKPVVAKIESLVDEILAAKKVRADADTSGLERQIDELVYQLYELTEEEMKIIKN